MDADTATRVVVVAAVIGFAGQLVLYGSAPGINVPIMVLGLLVAAWLLRSRSTPARRRDLVLPAAAAVFAAFVAVRGDPTLIALDVVAALGLTAAALLSLRGEAVLFAPLTRLAREGARLAASLLAGIGTPLSQALRSAGIGRRSTAALRGSAPLVRGLLLAVPPVVVFLALFSSADAVFAALVSDLFAVDLDLGDAIGRGLLALVIGWLAGGALAFSAGLVAGPAAGQEGENRWRLGVTEAVVVLGAVNLVFAAFVAIQGAYLFGGLDTLEASGLTYAEYARRGFFELVAVALLAGGLIWGLERLVASRPIAYRALAVSLALLTGVVLVSALLRLHLYQAAYGWTVARFYVAAAIAWLAAGVLLAVLTVVRGRSAILPHGLLLAAIAVGLAVNVIGPERFVAQANVARALDSSLVPPDGRRGLDARYVASLGDDAVPVLLDALPHLDGADRRIVVFALHQREVELSLDASSTGWPAWNLGRERARALLTPIADQLATEAEGVMDDGGTVGE